MHILQLGSPAYLITDTARLLANNTVIIAIDRAAVRELNPKGLGRLLRNMLTVDLHVWQLPDVMVPVGSDCQTFQ